jgi:large subunit ribosomal protein L24
MEGSLAYSWASGERPPRIELALSAPDIDLDRAYALAQGALADTVFEWPREGTLSLKVGRTMVAGVEARQADIDLQFDRRGLEIARLSIGDFGGAAVAVTGSVDTQASRGTLAFGVDGRSFDGIAKLIEKFAPQAAAEFRRSTVHLVPAKLQALLTVGAEPPPAAASPNAALRITGSAGGFKVDLQAQTHPAAATFTADTLSRLTNAKLDLTGRIDAGEGGALVELLGLDPLVAVGTPPGRLTFAANGPLDGDMAITGELVAGGLDASAEGSLRLADSDGVAVRAAIRIAQATLRNPRPRAAGRPIETLPIALTANLALAGGVVDLTDIAGTAAGIGVGGHLKIGLAEPVTVDGDIDIVEFDLLSVIAAATGTSLQRGTAAVWPAEPFEQGLLGEVSGQLRIKSAHVALTPRQAVRNVRSVVHFDRSKLAFEQIDGAFAGGHVAGEIVFGRESDSITVQSRLRLTDADLAELVRGGPPPLSGRLTTDIEVQGTGRSPIALVGALKGGGTFTLRDGGIARLDPGAFGAAIRSVDQGLSIDPERVRERMEQALAAAALTIALAEGEIAIADGQAHLSNTVVRAQGADLAVSGRAMLTEDLVDAKLVLSGSARPDALGGARPDIAITLKGPIDAPKRALDVAAFSNWLALRFVEQQSKRIDALESSPSAGDTPDPQDTAPGAQPSATTPATPTGTIRPATQPRPRPTTQPAVPSVSPARPPLDLRPPPPRRSSQL